MTTPDSHSALRGLIPAAALGALPDDELGEVLGHAEACSECRARLEEYDAVVASLGSGLPAQSIALPVQSIAPRPIQAVRERLLARASADAPATRPADRRLYADRWAGWLVAAGVAGVVLVHHSIHRPIALGWLAAGVLLVALGCLGSYARIQRARVAALERQLEDRERNGAADLPISGNSSPHA